MICLNIDRFISTFAEHSREKPYYEVTYNLTPYPLYCIVHLLGGPPFWQGVRMLSEDGRNLFSVLNVSHNALWN